MDKKIVRKNLMEKRKILQKDTHNYINNTLKLQENIINSPLFNSAKIICNYASTETEIPTTRISEQAFTQKKILLFPRCDKTQKGIMEFFACQSFQDLESGYYGILEPKNSCPQYKTEELNNADTLIFVPALAFTHKGYRIGYGQGFYDRYLAKIPQAISIGITLSALLDDTIPLESWDMPVHYLATEKEIIKLR